MVYGKFQNAWGIDTRHGGVSYFAPGQAGMVKGRGAWTDGICRGELMDFAIATFKFVGIVLTGVFGVYGLLVRFKTEDGAVTKAGRIALIMIIIATFVAFGSHALEIARQKEATQAAVERTEKMLAEIKRGLHPIKHVRVSYQIEVPTKHIEFEGYVRRCKIGADYIIRRLRTEESVPGIIDTQKNSNGYVVAFDFNSTSLFVPGPVTEIVNEAGETVPLAPNAISPNGAIPLPPIDAIPPGDATEWLPHFILHHVDVYMQLYRKPITVDDHPWLQDNSDLRPDLTLFAGSELSVEPPADHGPHQIHYEVKAEKFQIRAHAIPSNPQNWESTGAIVSVSDFVGAQLFVTLPSQTRTGGPEVEMYRRDLQKQFELKTVVLDISDGFRLTVSDFTKRNNNNNNGYPVFVYTFPTTMDGLLDLCR